MVLEMISRVLSSKGEFSNKPSFPLNLSNKRSGLMIRDVKPNTFPKIVPSKIDFPKPTKTKSYLPSKATSAISVSISPVALKMVVISWLSFFDSFTIGSKVSFSYSSMLKACISSLMVKCIAVTLAASGCPFTKLLAKRKSDLPFSLFPKEIKILNFEFFLTSEGIMTSLVLKIKLMMSSAGPVIKVVTKAIITIMVNTFGDKTPSS